MRLLNPRVPFVVAVIASLAACAAVTAVQTKQPLNPVQVQQDLANAAYLMKASGCAIDAAGSAAAPIIQIAADTKGNQVLTGIDAAGNVACQLTVPPSALPVPAPAGAPAAQAKLTS